MPSTSMGDIWGMLAHWEPCSDIFQACLFLRSPKRKLIPLDHEPVPWISSGKWGVAKEERPRLGWSLSSLSSIYMVGTMGPKAEYGQLAAGAFSAGW